MCNTYQYRKQRTVLGKKKDEKNHQYQIYSSSLYEETFSLFVRTRNVLPYPRCRSSFPRVDVNRLREQMACYSMNRW